jgi:hypothetical protein
VPLLSFDSLGNVTAEIINAMNTENGLPLLTLISLNNPGKYNASNEIVFMIADQIRPQNEQKRKG